MAGSRLFASGDELRFALGAPLVDDFVLAVTLKLLSRATQTWIGDLSNGYQFGLDGGPLAIFESAGSANFVETSPVPLNTWGTVMVSKTAGSVQCVFSWVPADGSTPVHPAPSETRGGSYADLRSLLGWVIRGQALIASVALYDAYRGSAIRNTFTSSAAIEAAAPLHLWDERDGFTNDRGSDGAADRTSITGTSHSTDEPGGWWGSAPATPGDAMVGVGDRRAVVFWTELNTPPDGYRVYRDGVEVYDGAGTGDRGTVAFEDTGLTNGVEHTWTVTAYVGGDESAPSGDLVATPIAPTPHGGGSRSFDGTDLVRLLPGIEPQEQPNATFVLVLKPDSVSPAMGLLRADAAPAQSDTRDPFAFRMSSSGELILDVYNPESTSSSASGIRLTAGVWQMIAVTFFTPNRTPPRFHHKNMATGVVAHANGSPDHTYTIHPHGTWTVGDRFSGLIALAAVIEQSDDADFETLDLDTIAALAYAQWDERDGFLEDRSAGTAYALRNAITGTTHSTDSPPSLWAPAFNRLAMVV
ncbi:hypothetical protein [Conexibacter sp. CPCC 206217]|uniref:hypothetical protein n=1 Tax=Conexibacter sp. CPCC 206217 TaxID=3064574 RepID=UPI00271B9CB0|nr:hypothetical protein [Conexibacter sp. CPCC 206217]MDO8209283.1 hypothetical protein [Conexibacter sp. CPCC 206217]